MDADNAIVVVAALACLICFLIPIWVMSPFKRQGDRELRLALTLLRIGPNITLIFALIAVGFAFRSWSNWVVVAVVSAILMRVNVCELVFRPYGRLDFGDADSVSLRPSDMVVSVSLGGETHAYSVGLMGYHHVVNDAVGGLPILASYCALCHTGIVWKRDVDGRTLNFHLLGIRDGNALLIDAETGSTWQQSTGVSIFGPLEGKQLEMVFSDELSYGLWRSEYPDGKMLKPRPAVHRFYFNHGWENFVTYFRPLIDTADSGIAPREVMLGISIGSASKAFPLDVVLKSGGIRDHVGEWPVTLVVGPDGTSVRAFRTADRANFSGVGADDQRLAPVDCVKHFWYDWRRSHPKTEVYRS